MGKPKGHRTLKSCRIEYCKYNQLVYEWQVSFGSGIATRNFEIWHRDRQTAEMLTFASL